jgi:biopolymer transport protein ExbD
MAEIAAVSKGKRRSHSLKVDLTPMVDLGFLLISFFVFTSTLSQTQALFLPLPKDGPPTKIPDSGAVTLIVRSEGVYYYEGDTPLSISDVKKFGYHQKDELRQMLLQLKRRLIHANGNDEKLMVLIKPAEESNMGMLVDMFDEMIICGIGRYSIADLNEIERSW